MDWLKLGIEYWYIDVIFGAFSVQCVKYSESNLDLERIRLGNCYRHKREAEAALMRVMAVFKIYPGDGRGWIGVDLDGTLAEYHNWEGIEHIGKPIPCMVNRVKQWLADGKEVRIFTARVSLQQDLVMLEKARNAINAWCRLYIGQELPITCTKDWHMIELWDDRCVQVDLNTGHPIRSFR